MLPKVATNLLHSTVTRSAAAAVQNHPTLRNVLKPASTSTGASTSGSQGPALFTPSGAAAPGPGLFTPSSERPSKVKNSALSPSGSKTNAHGGAHGPGSGGAKKNKAFYTGYNGAARAVTQANALTSQDTTHEEEDTHPVSRRGLLKKAAATTTAPKKSRLRSSSVNSLSLGRKEPTEKPLVVETGSVLKTVQLQARSLHALTAAQQQQQESVAQATEELSKSPTPPPLTRTPSRRNSVSSPVSTPTLNPADVPLPGSPAQQPSSIAAEEPSKELPQRPSPLSQYGWDISAAVKAEDPQALARAVEALKNATSGTQVADYNAALQALMDNRKRYAPINDILEVYHALLAHSVHPNFRTYALLLDLFTARDFEVQRTIKFLEADPTQCAQERLETLRAEPNFSSAMKLFEAVSAVDGNRPDVELPMFIYKRLLASAGMHGNVQAAVRVLSDLEVKNLPPAAEHFRYLMQAFSNAGDLKGAELVFGKYRAKEAEGEFKNERQKLLIWNEALELAFKKGESEKAIGLLEEMLRAAEAKSAVGAASIAEGSAPVDPVLHIPTPAAATYSAIIAGFVHVGDVASAIVWFDKLSEQADAPGEDPLVPGADGRPSRPDQVTWLVFLHGLIKDKRVDELNKYFPKFAEDAAKTSIFNIRMKLIDLNLESLDNVTSPDVALQRLDTAAAHILEANRPWRPAVTSEIHKVTTGYIKYGKVEEAAAFLQAAVASQAAKAHAGPEVAHYDRSMDMQKLAHFALTLVEAVHAALPNARWSFRSAAGLAEIVSETLGSSILPAQAGWLLHAYATDRAAGVLDLTKVSLDVWRIMVSSAVYLEQNPSAAGVVPGFAFEGLASLVSDLAANGVAFDDELCDISARAVIVGLIQGRHGAQFARDFFKGLGGSYSQTYVDVVASPEGSSVGETVSTPPTTPDSAFRAVSPLSSQNQPLVPKLDTALSKTIDNLLKDYTVPPAEKAAKGYALFQQVLGKGLMVQIPVLGRLIQTSGRLGELARVHELYEAGQGYLAVGQRTIPETARLSQWVLLEDSMIIALAHSGQIERAHEHRGRILDLARRVPEGAAWAAPSADAYGALMLGVKETTDDAAGAYGLWCEAVALGVRPNIYLYNNIISKLAKARKADKAVELFGEMKAAGLKPSSITYGAVIGACARVGDAVSAETLFAEMAAQPNFKARVPPFNMMMQLYVTTKPNRERALWYYEEMVRQGVKPTAHTYKLLMDVYGTLEPVDIGAMEAVFETIKSEALLSNTHFASLINAYGCVTKQLDKAIEVFNTIPVHGIARDAVAYEALINALVANKRTDLIDQYLAFMKGDQVHMTAYVANFLIKGLANAGEVERARAVFEEMVDPPVGVAGKGNHVPHDAAEAVSVGVEEPVYREPSTWEAMIRAELGVGERERAAALLERLSARGYPDAVFNRIAGVMVDHSAVV